MIEICFVCTGNTCRSVMAERIAKKMAKRKKIEDIKFSSAGISTNAENITENASKALKKSGYDGRNRKSVQLKTKNNVVYVAVTNEHKKFIDSKNVLSFDDLSGKVVDPYGQSLEVYLKTVKEIEKNIEILLEKIQNLRGVLW